MYQEQVLSYKHLDEPLDEGRFVFECILAGNLQPFTRCRPQLFDVQHTLDCILYLFALTFFREIMFLLQNCAKLDNPKIN